MSDVPPDANHDPALPTGDGEHRGDDHGAPSPSTPSPATPSPSTPGANFDSKPGVDEVIEPGYGPPSITGNVEFPASSYGQPPHTQEEAAADPRGPSDSPPAVSDSVEHAHPAAIDRAVNAPTELDAGFDEAPWGARPTPLDAYDPRVDSMAEGGAQSSFRPVPFGGGDTAATGPVSIVSTENANVDRRDTDRFRPPQTAPLSGRQPKSHDPEDPLLRAAFETNKFGPLVKPVVMDTPRPGALPPGMEQSLPANSPLPKGRHKPGIDTVLSAMEQAPVHDTSALPPRHPAEAPPFPNPAGHAAETDAGGPSGEPAIPPPISGPLPNRDASDAAQAGTPLSSAAAGLQVPQADTGGTLAAGPDLLWYVYAQRRQIGPFRREEIEQRLRDGTVSARNHVWRLGFGDTWHRIRDVAEFRTLVAQLAPDELSAEGPAPKLHCPNCGHRIHRHWERCGNCTLALRLPHEDIGDVLTTRARLAPIVAAAAGVGMVVSLFLPWMTAGSASHVASTDALGIRYGGMLAALSIVSALFALQGLHARSRRSLLPWLVTAGALAIVGVNMTLVSDHAREIAYELTTTHELQSRAPVAGVAAAAPEIVGPASLPNVTPGEVVGVGFIAYAAFALVLLMATFVPLLYAVRVRPGRAIATILGFGLAVTAVVPCLTGDGYTELLKWRLQLAGLEDVQVVEITTGATLPVASGAASDVTDDDAADSGTALSIVADEPFRLQPARRFRAMGTTPAGDARGENASDGQTGRGTVRYHFAQVTIPLGSFDALRAVPVTPVPDDEVALLLTMFPQQPTEP